MYTHDCPGFPSQKGPIPGDTCCQVRLLWALCGNCVLASQVFCLSPSLCPRGFLHLRVPFGISGVWDHLHRRRYGCATLSPWTRGGAAASLSPQPGAPGPAACSSVGWGPRPAHRPDPAPLSVRWEGWVAGGGMMGLKIAAGTGEAAIRGLDTQCSPPARRDGDY